MTGRSPVKISFPLRLCSVKMTRIREKQCMRIHHTKAELKKPEHLRLNVCLADVFRPVFSDKAFALGQIIAKQRIKDTHGFSFVAGFYTN